MRIVKIIFATLSIIFFSGCGSNINQNMVVMPTVYYTPEYIFSLESVSINGKNITDIDKENLKFEDKNIIVMFSIEHKHINIEVFNKRNDTLKLLWNDIVYISYDGKSNGILHNGIKYSEKDLIQYPSYIVANSQIKDIIVPRNKIIFLREWYVRDLLSWEGMDTGTFNTGNKTKAEERANLYLGKTISLIIPIQNKDKIDEYTFDFLVKNYKVVTYDKYNY